MIKAAIDRILELAAAEIIAVDGERRFSARPIHPIKPSHPTPLALSTLYGVVDIVVNLLEDSERMEGVQIHIVGPDRVDVMSPIFDGWMERHCYAIAKSRPCEFPFDRQLDVEQFIINMQLHFEESDAKAEILRFVSHLSTNEVRLASDDGLSQTAVLKTEIGRKENASIAPVQKLKPFRTFREIDQPEGEFLLRLYPGRGELPLVALHQAEGTAWRDEAIGKIYDHFRAFLPTITILR